MVSDGPYRYLSEVKKLPHEYVQNSSRSSLKGYCQAFHKGSSYRRTSSQSKDVQRDALPEHSPTFVLLPNCWKYAHDVQMSRWCVLLDLPKADLRQYQIPHSHVASSQGIV